jgi:ABC-type sugar transport system ATPase subunit
VSVVERLGTTTLVHIAAAGPGDLITVEIQGKSAHKVGDPVWLKPDSERCHLFDGNGNRLPA